MLGQEVTHNKSLLLCDNDEAVITLIISLLTPATKNSAIKKFILCLAGRNVLCERFTLESTSLP